MRSGQTGRGMLLLLGAVAGAAAALALLPRARSTATAQLALALGRPPEWMRAAYGGSRPGVERLAHAQPEDVELQIALAALPAPESAPTAAEDTVDRMQHWKRRPAQVISRLEALARRFPESAAVRAHQLRYLSAEGITLDHRIEQRTLDRQPVPAGSVTPVLPDPDVVRRFDAIAAEGERLEPDNAYFAAMRAVAAFAARNDAEALRHLHRAATKRYWNDHAASEVLAQWRLMQRAYGDRGALQKLPSFYSMLFPHFAPMRATARLALVHAARRELAGDRVEAQGIRRDIMGLGAALADSSVSVIGRLVGMAIFQIGLAPVPPEPPLRIRVTNPPSGLPDWRPPTPEEQQRHSRARRERYAAAVAVGDPAQAAWIRATGNRMDKLHRQHRRWMMSSPDDIMARLNRLTAWWVLGILLWWQILALLLVGAIGAVIARSRGEAGGVPDAGVWGMVYLALFLAPALITTPLWGFDVLAGSAYTLLIAALFLGLLLCGTLALAQWRGHRHAALDEESSLPASSEAGPGWLLLAPLAALLPSIAAVLLLRGAETLPSGGVLPAQPAAEASLAILAALGVAARQIYPFPDVSQTLTPASLDDTQPLLLVPAALPALLLLFLALCRTAAKNLPLGPGLGHALRRAAPVAALLLAAIYLASLPSTLAADRAVEQYIEQAIRDELGVTPVRP